MSLIQKQYRSFYALKRRWKMKKSFVFLAIAIFTLITSSAFAHQSEQVVGGGMMEGQQGRMMQGYSKNMGNNHSMMQNMRGMRGDMSGMMQNTQSQAFDSPDIRLGESKVFFLHSRSLSGFLGREERFSHD
jgi:hypothetical protein